MTIEPFSSDLRASTGDIAERLAVSDTSIAGSRAVIPAIASSVQYVIGLRPSAP